MLKYASSNVLFTAGAKMSTAKCILKQELAPISRELG